MSYGKTYHLIHASFSQIVEVKAQTAPSFAAAVRQLLLNQDGDGVTLRLWNADTGEYLDRRVFISLRRSNSGWLFKFAKSPAT